MDAAPAAWLVKLRSGKQPPLIRRRQASRTSPSDDPAHAAEPALPGRWLGPLEGEAPKALRG